MPDFSVDELVQRGLTLGILAQEQLQDVWAVLGTQNAEVEPFLAALLRQGHLTRYQVERLTSGASEGFYYGEYKVLYPVGAGSFARVYRSVHPESGKVAAIKVLRTRYASDPAAVDLFVREAELGMEFRHPNIVPVHEVRSEKNTHFMVMDFIEGQTLREFVNVRKKIDPKIATRITTDLCLGLDYAFKRGHLHRDLKMTNVILSSGGKSLLLDFGLASSDKEADPSRRNQRAIDYAALERSTGVRRDDKRSDLFFLGTMFYHMLTGVPPLTEARDRARRLDKTRFMNVKPITQIEPSVPFAVSFIVDKAMNLNPEKRYQSPAAMLVDLEVAVKKLESGVAQSEATLNRLASTSSLSLAHVARKESQVATVMIVEANPDMQNIFRNSLKKSGFRVLVLTNVERALERFEEHDQEIHCVLFNAQSLGPKAVTAFNEMARSRLTDEIPAILLLDENQIKWAARAMRAKHRVAVGMPISMKRLQEVMLKLIHENKKGAPSESHPRLPIPGAAAPAGALGGAAGVASGAASGVAEQGTSGGDVLEDSSGALASRDDPASTGGGSKQTAASHVDLASELDEMDNDYIAYLQADVDVSQPQSASFVAAQFDAALDVAVETMFDKIHARMGNAPKTEAPFQPEMSREDFLNATTLPPELPPEPQSPPVS